MSGRRGAGLAAALAALLAVASGAAPAPAVAAPATVTDGTVRFQVLTPSLVRIEHAADGRFEDRPTLTTLGRLDLPRPRVRTSVEGADRVLRTSRLTLRWRRGSGPPGAGDLRVTTRAGERLEPRPGPNPEPLGGWRRSLDLVDGPVPLHDGVLSRAGWYLLDDSDTALVTGDRFVERAGRDGYADLWLFAYGRDLRRGLRDLRALTGPAPLLPRKAFGVWFSRWWPYGDGDWREIAERFRRERLPLDTISLDTDFKRVHDRTGAAIAAEVVGAPGRPYSWNGWDWNRELFPEPSAFLRWARAAGLEVGLNVHPSISSSDPRFPATQARARGGLVEDPGCRVVQADPRGRCMVFDWADPDQLAAYLDLHAPFERDGADFWWLDWCCDGSRVEAEGLTADTWINRAYAERQRARGERWPAFSRIGGSFQGGFGANGGTGAFAEHRYSIAFTGDTCASWPLLAFAAEFTGAAASIGMPYVSHDIGTFHAVPDTGVCNDRLSPVLTPRASELPPEMYVRWVQLGAFQPLDRLHSHHGQRLPWEYPEREGRIAREFLRLRGALVPLLYALAREAHDTGVPMVRPLYLTWPREREAYARRTQFTLGRDVLVAPVTVPGDPAEIEVWFPPGSWVDLRTGERHRGPATERLRVPLERIPVFVRSGGIVPMQDGTRSGPRRPPTGLVLTALPGRGRTSVYDDAGEGLAYERGRFTRTAVRMRRAGRATVLVIGPARGRRFAGMPRRRRYEVRLLDVRRRPRVVTVGGRRARRVAYDARRRVLTVRTGTRSTRRAVRVAVR